MSEDRRPAWWVRRNAMDDLPDAAQHLAYQWRHFRDWERLTVESPDSAGDLGPEGLLEWHRKRIAEAISLLRVAHWKAGMAQADAKLGDPLLTTKAMAERYTPWPPMQTRQEAKAKDEPANHGDGDV